MSREQMSGILSIFVTLIAFFLITLTTVSVTVLTTLRGQELAHDPFAPYADVMPGGRRDAALLRGFICQYDTIHAFYETCFLTPEKGLFFRIQVSFVSDTGKISGTVFILRKNSLVLGDLIALWGKPEITQYETEADFRWPDVHALAHLHAYYDRFSYWLPITYVVFESSDL